MREKAKDMEDRVKISLYVIGVSEGKKTNEMKNKLLSSKILRIN